MSGKPGTPEEHALMKKYSEENNSHSDSRMVLWLRAHRDDWREFDPYDEGSW
jgi:hypothetical protein